MCATILTCTLLGVVIEKVAYTPLRNAPRISLLITAIGVSFFLEYTAELILGSGAKVIPAYYTNQTFRLGKVPLGVKTNCDELIGSVVKVTETVDNFAQTGTAIAQGKEWTARCKSDKDRIEKDSLAKVTAISGVKLILEKCKEDEL